MNIIKDSLDLIGNTPLLLVKNLDTGPCNLYLKLESFNLGGSIKDRPAKNMIIEAEKKGLLRKGGTIVEATAGNTGIALAIMAVKRGYKVVIIVPDKPPCLRLILANLTFSSLASSAFSSALCCANKLAVLSFGLPPNNAPIVAP